MASLPDACLLGYPRIPHTGESHALFYTYTHTLNTYTCPALRLALRGLP